MSWRTVVISRRCKLDLSMNYIEIRGMETQRVHLSEINTLIIGTTAVSLTSALLCELMHRKVKVVFCDEKRNPQSELVPYYGSNDCSVSIKKQIAWSEYNKLSVWTAILKEKLNMQKTLLSYMGEKEKADKINAYIAEITLGDKSNREAHAAKLYFAALFGDGFNRGHLTPTNAALDYGYTLLLSAFNKEIVSSGCITQIGIFHDNIYNPFNLSSDLMEPFRPLVDEVVLGLDSNNFAKEEKYALLDLFSQKVEIAGQHQHISNAIRLYTKSVLKALNEGDLTQISFYKPIRKEKLLFKLAKKEASLSDTEQEA
ncbi:MAG: type II CRISPR-associated endonuclease Cas1 [Eubacteriales bacterium]|nr:type II CRISPR-associated endonuclease Cas1 [Eubacteriales bacterium]